MTLWPVAALRQRSALLTVTGSEPTGAPTHSGEQVARPTATRRMNRQSEVKGTDRAVTGAPQTLAGVAWARPVARSVAQKARAADVDLRESVFIPTTSLFRERLPAAAHPSLGGSVVQGERYRFDRTAASLPGLG